MQLYTEKLCIVLKLVDMAKKMTMWSGHCIATITSVSPQKNWNFNHKSGTTIILQEKQMPTTFITLIFFIRELLFEVLFKFLFKCLWEFFFTSLDIGYLERSLSLRSTRFHIFTWHFVSLLYRHSLYLGGLLVCILYLHRIAEWMYSGVT